MKRYPSSELYDDREILLSGLAEMPERYLNSFEKIRMTEKGVSKTELERLKVKTGLDYDELASALSVTRATLINKKGKARFNAAVSERIISIAGLYSYGFSVFEDEQKFIEWMSLPRRPLGGKTPLELISTQFGRDEVMTIIGRIEYGVYS